MASVGVDKWSARTTMPSSWCASGSSSSPSSLPSLVTLFVSDGDGDSDNKQAKDTESMSISSSAGTEKSVADTAAVKIPDPPRYLSIGYNVAGLANAIAALGLLFNVGKINNAAVAVAASSRISSSFGTKSSSLSLVPSSASIAAVNHARIMTTRYQPNLLATYIAGSLGYLLLAAGTCNILSESVKTKRLYTSDTYKRLTMGLLLFGVLGLFSVPGEAGCIVVSSLSSPYWGGATTFLLTLLAKFITAIVSFVGWEYSAGGFGSSPSSSSYRDKMRDIVREMCGGCKRVWKTLPITDERPATFYRSFFVILTLGNLIFNTSELIFNLTQGIGLVSLPVSLTISSMARLGLMSVILYVLKDAAERKRLDGSTFITLNMMVGFWALGGKQELLCFRCIFAVRLSFIVASTNYLTIFCVLCSRYCARPEQCVT